MCTQIILLVPLDYQNIECYYGVTRPNFPISAHHDRGVGGWGLFSRAQVARATLNIILYTSVTAFGLGFGI